MGQIKSVYRYVSYNPTASKNKPWVFQKLTGGYTQKRFATELEAAQAAAEQLDVTLGELRAMKTGGWNDAKSRRGRSKYCYVYLLPSGRWLGKIMRNGRALLQKTCLNERDAARAVAEHLGVNVEDLERGGRQIAMDLPEDLGVETIPLPEPRPRRVLAAAKPRVLRVTRPAARDAGPRRVHSGRDLALAGDTTGGYYHGEIEPANGPKGPK